MQAEAMDAYAGAGRPPGVRASSDWAGAKLLAA